MDFSGIKDGKVRVVYESVWGGERGKVLDEIKKKEYTKKPLFEEPKAGEEKSSLRFADNFECEVIEEIYEIKHKENFEKKYKQAVSGNGNESSKILTIHSSSRLALLVFYNVENKPLILNIDGKDVEFKISAFEFKNPVINNRYPSNMDVMLVNKDRNIVLFLESKFAEVYLNKSKKTKETIKQQYKTNKYSRLFYDEKWLNSIGIIIENDDRLKKDEVNYLDGFKQMISHYVGIRNRIDWKTYKSDNEYPNEVLSVVKNPSRIYLGEIVYDKLYLPKESRVKLDPQVALKNYECLYSKLADKMNACISNDGLSDRFKVLPTQLKYSEIVNYKNNKKCIDPKTLDFYGLN